MYFTNMIGSGPMLQFERFRLFLFASPRVDLEIRRRIVFEASGFESPRKVILGYVIGAGVQVDNVLTRSITIEARYAADITRQYRKADISNRVIEVSLGTSLWERK